jgi:hypothetical protein
MNSPARPVFKRGTDLDRSPSGEVAVWPQIAAEPRFPGWGKNFPHVGQSKRRARIGLRKPPQPDLARLENLPPSRDAPALWLRGNGGGNT